MLKIAVFCMTLVTLLGFTKVTNASLTKEQSDEVAEFATNFIEEGNKRRDENGYPLLVYALSNNWNTCIEIRRSGYNSELYHVKNNNYHRKNGTYLDLGLKWTMDCGDYLSYVYHTTLGLDMMNHSNEDPWHIKDIYADANKYGNSQYFEFVYKNVPISSIDESKLQKGDLVLYFGPKDNHGLIYVGEGMQTAHASRNGIKYYKNPPILGFEIVTLNRFYKTSTAVSVVRVKDGVVPKDKKVNGTIIWPDNNEEGILIEREKLEKAERERLEEEKRLAEIHAQELAQAFEDAEKSGENGNDELVNAQDEGLDAMFSDLENPMMDQEVVYIEKEMFDWLAEGLKKLYNELSNNA